ncbi:arsenate reductase/protein-tyrosine-phosphatase family protein [Streptomyces kanasensis]|uniref:arsenate reductase/protein-tyrosine-phosphatase family protein n=1 Tax=Streptomyces kanasensis TaxID=936756 RepID=UPI003815392B
MLLLKALTGGIPPVAGVPVDGTVLLPAAALGQLAVMPVFLAASGWWRYARATGTPGTDRTVVSLAHVVGAGFFTSLVIGTTALNFTFTGVSVLLVLLLMRGGVLIASPLIDKARERHVTPSAWTALLLSLAAVLVAVGGVRDFHLPPAAVASVCVYLIGYAGRFEIMSRVAKSGVVASDRRYFVLEHATAPVCLVVLLVAGALAGQPGLRAGFTTFLTSPEALTAAAVGVAYEVLFVFGTLIYLDRRAFSWCVPVNRCASLVSGVIAAYLLHHVAGLPTPTTAELVGLALVVAAIGALCYPTVASRRLRSGGGARRVLFVCGGNTFRSPLAELVARDEVARQGRAASSLRITSAGVTVPARWWGARMSPHTTTALAGLGIRPAPGAGHPRLRRARPVTPRLCRSSALIYCMTRDHRDAVLAVAPEVAGRTLCLDPDRDIPDPHGASADVHLRCARHIQRAVRQRLRQFPGPDQHPPALGTG